MTEEDKPQAVVTETEVPAKPGAEVEGARTEPDLDKLLAQYDEQVKSGSTETEPEKAKPGTGDDLSAIRKEVSDLKKRDHEREFRADMDATIKTVKGDLPFDDATVEALIDAEARKDPRLARAWRDRADSPKQFQQVVEALGRTLAKKFTRLPDLNATEDRALVSAAVRGASTKAPEGKAPDYSKLSNQEFNRKVEDELGFNPGT